MAPVSAIVAQTGFTIDDLRPDCMTMLCPRWQCHTVSGGTAAKFDAAPSVAIPRLT